MGGEGVPPNTRPEDVAAWVAKNDRIPLLLAISLYGDPITVLDDYYLEAYSERFGIWVSDIGNPVIFGLKGTSTKSGRSDLNDDKVRSSMTISWSK